jgi:hypothetical protein
MAMPIEEPRFLYAIPTYGNLVWVAVVLAGAFTVFVCANMVVKMSNVLLDRRVGR